MFTRVKNILILATSFLVLSPAFAVRDLNAFQMQIKHSEIKAIATVEKVVITDWENAHQTKKIWFKTLKAFNKKTPSEFTGYCMSFKNRWFWENKTPSEGGYIFYYPKRGETVLVTITQNNGSVSSLKFLNEDEKNQLLNKNWEDIKVKPLGFKILN